MKNKFVIIIIALITGVAIGLLSLAPVTIRNAKALHRLQSEASINNTSVVNNYDTIAHANPTPSSISNAGTVLVPISHHDSSGSKPLIDTVIIHDTLYVQLQLERKTYQDSTYKAVVSGYRPALDSIEIYRRTEIRTISRAIPYDKYSKFAAGPFIGVGWTGKAIVPVVGLSVHYDLFRIRSSTSVIKD